MRIMVGVGDLVLRIRDDQAQVGYSVVGRSRGRVTLCAVCTVHKQTRSISFLVQPQNQG
jgi:alpha-D-ribose 1-methylphosphonate 5-triphosphate synthase subunit PhnG